MIDSLSAEQRVAVEEFIRHLEKTPQQKADSRSALNSFVREHPEHCVAWPSESPVSEVIETNAEMLS